MQPGSYGCPSASIGGDRQGARGGSIQISADGVETPSTGHAVLRRLSTAARTEAEKRKREQQTWRPQRSRKYSEEQIRDIVSSYQDGQSVYEVAAQHGCSRQAVSNYLHAAGISLRGSALPTETVRLIQELHRHGLRPQAIARRLQIDPGTVKRKLSQLASPQPPTES